MIHTGALCSAVSPYDTTTFLGVRDQYLEEAACDEGQASVAVAG